jgi:hypothetical protein
MAHDDDKPTAPPVSDLGQIRQRKRLRECFDAASDAVAARGDDAWAKLEAEQDNVLFRLFGRAAFVDGNICTRNLTREERKRYGKRAVVYYLKDHPDAPRFVVYERYRIIRDGDSGEPLAGPWRESH